MNEKLHQAVCQWTLREEQQELITEGLEWDEVEFEDNADVCSAIERSSSGLLACVDEVSLRRGGADVLSSVSSSEGENAPASAAELLIERADERLGEHPKLQLRTEEEDGGDSLPRHCFR